MPIYNALGIFYLVVGLYVYIAAKGHEEEEGLVWHLGLFMFAIFCWPVLVWIGARR